MPEQPADVRNKDFSEVTLGYSILDAQYEAARCIQCKDPACVAGCPVGIDIPGFLEMIVQEDLTSSINL